MSLSRNIDVNPKQKLLLFGIFFIQGYYFSVINIKLIMNTGTFLDIYPEIKDDTVLCSDCSQDFEPQQRYDDMYDEIS